MNSYTIGSAYEDFVETVYKAILEAERRQGNIAPVIIERNKTITSKSGTPAEIDIYWEYQVAGITHKVAIECKNYNKNIDIPRVRDFARKIENISGLKGLMVTKKGFSENAITEASSDNIDLLVIREQTPDDWEDRLKQINIRIHILTPSRTINIIPMFDKEWMLANGYKEGEHISYSTTNNLIVIDDVATGFRYRLLDLEQNDFFEDVEPGKHTWEKILQDGWIYFDQVKLKLKMIKIEYLKPALVHHEINIDFEQYVLAVMEYINGQQDKFVILKTGERKKF